MSGGLKGLIRRGETLIVPGAFDAASAMLIEKAGFKAFYVSGAGVSNSNGLPDAGLLSRDDVARLASYMIKAVDIPAIVDCDTGFGGPEDTGGTVALFEELGARAVQIEDQRYPKRCGHLPGKEVVAPEEFVEKIEAAVRARKSGEFLIIARTDAYAVEGMEAAIERGRIYAEAGADIIFPEALTTRDEFEYYASEVRAPLMANMTEFGKTPYFTVDEFKELGYSIVIFPMTAFRAAMKAMEAALFEIRDKGTQEGILGKLQTRAELYELLKYRGFEEPR
ncbi:MAG: methylisocitrate lyase [Deltaproteobacteria bacterium]|nr:methylisocitrate lyase [Deltaproteobacteria bacterium]